MSSQFDYRATSPHPAAAMFAALVDPTCIRARLEALGGPGAALLEHEADTESARFRVRHGLDPANIPPAIRSFLPADFVIERQETWRHSGDGRYAGMADVEVPGTPAAATAQMGLRDTAGGNTAAGGTGPASEYRVRTDVTVRVPLFGGRIEATVGEQIIKLLEAENAFTLEWMTKHG